MLCTLSFGTVLKRFLLAGSLSSCLGIGTYIYGLVQSSVTKAEKDRNRNG